MQGGERAASLTPFNHSFNRKPSQHAANLLTAGSEAFCQFAFPWEFSPRHATHQAMNGFVGLIGS